jgi:hypothetical protein
LLQALAELLRDVAAEDVGAAARADRHDEAHRPRRIVLRERRGGEEDAERDAGKSAPRAHGAAC